ncbi:RNA-guided endonuclease TnpB family protein [Actinomadura kijaniata]|uniref:IS605 OrfB family transposase n=1 Tax=Actinomadura namibiensis TaxID=182080 RepID=A0A7W3LSK7_ACTNM|nr:RNA-guided endonuclease TnpB family protein [Actinomadura namibiensis]MBA8953513.1 IS605 OrfB family transposase [Actinomadura namibiensis]
MYVVVRVKLEPSAEDAAALGATLHAVNKAANEVSRTAFAHGVKREYALRKLTYAGLKERGLGAQAAQHVIKKVCGAYAVLAGQIRSGFLRGERRRRAESKPIAFRPDAAHPFDDRCLSWQLHAWTVSIWTVHGRKRGIRFSCSGGDLEMLFAHRKGETDLVFRDGMWFLMATCEVPAPPVAEPNGFIGVDLGIANIATTSDGARHVGRGLNRHRRRQAALRAKLQAKRTRSARRLLRKRRRREARHARNINHRISKQVVAEAERTGRGIALEDLSGIRDRERSHRSQRAILHSWSFHQLAEFLEYKARRAGVALVRVNPAYTSRTCADCGHRERTNRVSQARFVCRSCGVVAHADLNASRNIARLGEAAWNAGRESRVPAASP